MVTPMNQLERLQQNGVATLIRVTEESSKFKTWILVRKLGGGSSPWISFFKECKLRVGINETFIQKYITEQGKKDSGQTKFEVD